VLAIRGKPIATMSEMLALSSIKEAVGGENADQMVRTIIADFQTMIGELRRGLTQAEEAGDETTGDMILDMLSSLEKHVWMLESFIG
jgi:starvation-inducible DNA-binding protein